MCDSSSLNWNFYQIIQVFWIAVHKPNTRRSHWATTSTRPGIVWNLIPIWPIFFQNLNAFHACFSWSTAWHLGCTYFILNSNLLWNFIEIFEIFELIYEGLSCGNVHHCIITVFPLHIDGYLLDPFLVRDLKHFLMNDFSAGVKLPITVLVSHSVAYCGKDHAGFVPIYKGISWLNNFGLCFKFRCWFFFLLCH